jgi:hypothetical protein
VSTTFDDQAQAVLPGEGDAGSDIAGMARLDGIRARGGCPCMEPSRILGSARLIAYPVGIPDMLLRVETCAAMWVSLASLE